MRSWASFRPYSPFGSKNHRSNKSRNRTRFRIALESLEGRAVPAVITWDGGAGTSKFNDAANWNVDRIPGPEDDVVIPDLPAGKAVVINGITKLRSINAEAPIVLDLGTNVYVRPGLNDEGVLFVTAGNSKLSDGIFAPRAVHLYAKGNATSLSVEGPIVAVNSSTDLTPQTGVPRSSGFRVRAMDGAKITLKNPNLPEFRDMEFTSQGAGAQILIQGQRQFVIHEQLNFITGGGTISLPDLEKVTINEFARTFNVLTWYYEQPAWFNDLTNEKKHNGGSILMPNLTEVVDTQSDRTRKTSIGIGGSGDVMDLPKLKSLRNATIQFGSPGVEGLGTWNAPQLESIVRSSISFGAIGRSLRLAGLKNLDETSIFVGGGFLTVDMDKPIDLGNARWNTNYVSNGPLTSLTITTPDIRGPIGQGNFFRIEALNGGLVTINAESLADTNESKTDGGVYLRADNQGVLRMNVRKTRGTTLDLPPTGIAAFDLARDVRFKQIWGWSSGSGKLYSTAMETLTVDTFVGEYIRTGGSSMAYPEKYDVDKIIAPRLEAIYGTSLRREGWNAPAWPAFRTVTWDGGAGTNSWYDAANWSDDKIPGLNSDVIIPAQANLSEILIDSNVSVRSIESREPLRMASVSPFAMITVQVTSGASAFHAGLTLRAATVSTRYSGTTLNVYGTTQVETLLPDNFLYFHQPWVPEIGFVAENGSWLFVHDTTSLSSPIGELFIKSVGGGSRVVFPSLTSIEFRTVREKEERSFVHLIAEDRAEIDLPQLRTLTTNIAIVRIQDSWISSPNLNALQKAVVTVIDSTDDGIRHAEWIVPNLTSLKGSVLNIVGKDQTVSFDKLRTIDGTDIRVEKSKVYFPAIDRIDMTAHFQLRDSVVLSYVPYFWSSRKGSGYESYGEGTILEIRANEISGDGPFTNNFDITATGGLVYLHIPVIKPVATPVDIYRRFILSASRGGVLRSYATTVDGVAIQTSDNGVVAMDQVRTATLLHVKIAEWLLEGGKFYASSLESLRVTDTYSKSVTDLNMIVAPKLKSIEGIFEAIANPFPLIESIKGSITLKHEPGTPTTQITVFDTPKIRNFDNLKVTMEPAVRWPQYQSGGEGVGAMSFALVSSEEGSGSSDNGGGAVIVPAAASGKSVVAPQPEKAKSAKNGAAATANAKAKAPVPVKAVKKPAATKPAAKPKIAPKPVVIKPAPVKKAAAKITAKR